MQGAWGRPMPAGHQEVVAPGGQLIDDPGRVPAYGQGLEPPGMVGDRIGAVGFCAGGGNVYSLAFASQDLTAGVAYYGTPPNPLPSFETLTAQLLCIFSETDRNQNARIPELVAGLVANRKSFGLHLYQGTGHGFHNDTGAVYNRAAACDAWAKTIAFFSQHLRA